MKILFKDHPKLRKKFEKTWWKEDGKYVGLLIREVEQEYCCRWLVTENEEPPVSKLWNIGHMSGLKEFLKKHYPEVFI